MSDYNKGMQHAMGGSSKVNNPNVASEDTGSRNEYYDEMINRAADDYLNEWGGKDSAETKEAWAAYGEQVDGIVEQRDAYNRSAMGVNMSAGGVDAAGHDYYKSFEGEEKPITPTQSLIDDMFNAGGKGLEEVEKKEDDAALGNFLDDMFNDGGKWKQEALGIDREDEVQKIKVLLAAQKQSEINIVQNLKNTVYSEAFTYFDDHPELLIVFQNQAYGNSSTEELTDDQLYQLKLDYAEIVWQQDPASQIDTSVILADIDTKFENLEEEAIADLDKVLENELLLDENAVKRDELDIMGEDIDTRLIKNGIAPETAESMVKEALVNLPAGFAGEYIDLIENGQCNVAITTYDEYYLTKGEATDLYYDEQEQRNELFGLLVSTIESVVTGNPAPLVANVAELIASELAGDELEEFLSQGVISLIAAGGNFAEFAKGQAQDVLIESLLNTVDAARHDVTKIEGGYYCDTEITLQPHIDISPTQAIGMPGDSHVVNPAFVMLRLTKKGGEYINNPINPLNYVITQ